MTEQMAKIDSFQLIPSGSFPVECRPFSSLAQTHLFCAHCCLMRPFFSIRSFPCCLIFPAATKVRQFPVWRSRLCLLLTLGAACLSAYAQPTSFTASAPWPPLLQQAQTFLQQQARSAALPADRLDITLSPPKPLPALPPPSVCSQLEAFLPRGARLTGATLVGLRCATSRNGQSWQITLRATIRRYAQIAITTHPLPAGAVLTAQDTTVREWEISQQPNMRFVEAQRLPTLLGATLLRPAAAGLPLREDAIRLPGSITPGETVGVEINGQGFRIRTEGQAIQACSPGQTTQIRLASGRLISGTLLPGKTVAIDQSPSPASQPVRN